MAAAARGTIRKSDHPGASAMTRHGVVGLHCRGGAEDTRPQHCSHFFRTVAHAAMTVNVKRPRLLVYANTSGGAACPNRHIQPSHN
jgi:hypothetical protein